MGAAGGHSSGESTWSFLYVYVNDMPLQVQHGCLLQVADDTCLICYVDIPGIVADDTCLICSGDTSGIVAQALQDDLCMY